MKLLEFKQFNNSEEPKTLNKKKVVISGIVVLIIVIFTVIGMVYVSNQNFRNFMDTYVLFKTCKENDLASINIDTEKNIYTYAYYNYVVVLENNKLTLYNSSGKVVESFEVNISSPIFASQDNYLVVAEKDNTKAYLFKDKKMIWQKDVDGQISRVNINENGYVSIIVSGTSYKSVITTYAQDGAEVFKTFLSNAVAIDSDISRDNKYLSFCEMDLSGTFVQSKVKIISIDKAKQDPANSIIYTYEIPANSLVTNLEYHDRDELICLCDNKVLLLKNGNIETLAEIDSSVTFTGAKLSKSYFKVIEDKYGINNQNSRVEIYNTSSRKVSTYTIKGVAKEVTAKDGVIAVNLGTEAYFISESGFLKKKYVSNQEIKNIVISNNVAGIIYRNKIEFMGL